MSDLGSDAGSLVRAARDEAGLSAEERMRMRAKIMTAARAGAFAAVGTAGFAAAAKTFASSAVVWVVAGSLAVAGAGAYYVHSEANGAHLEHPAPKTQAKEALLAPSKQVLPADETTPPPAAVAIEEGTPPVAALGDVPRVTRSRPPPIDARARAAPAPSADTTFAEDARLLRDVRAALAAGQNERALSLLDSRKAGLPAGALAEEREAARIVTLCKLGRGAEARARATRFLAAHGSSPLAERVRRACAAER